LLEAIECVCAHKKAKSESRVFQESFSQGQEREEASWYEGNGQSSQESPFQEALQPVQEAWERVHHAH
jgi:hypothetical protein